MAPIFPPVLGFHHSRENSTHYIHLNGSNMVNMISTQALYQGNKQMNGYGNRNYGRPPPPPPPRSYGPRQSIPPSRPSFGSPQSKQPQPFPGGLFCYFCRDIGRPESDMRSHCMNDKFGNPWCPYAKINVCACCLDYGHQENRCPNSNQMFTLQMNADLPMPPARSQDEQFKLEVAHMKSNEALVNEIEKRKSQWSVKAGLKYMGACKFCSGGNTYTELHTWMNNHHTDMCPRLASIKCGYCLKLGHNHLHCFVKKQDAKLQQLKAKQVQYAFDFVLEPEIWDRFDFVFTALPQDQTPMKSSIEFCSDRDVDTSPIKVTTVPESVRLLPKPFVPFTSIPEFTETLIVLPKILVVPRILEKNDSKKRLQIRKEAMKLRFPKTGIIEELSRKAKAVKAVKAVKAMTAKEIEAWEFLTQYVFQL